MKTTQLRSIRILATLAAVALPLSVLAPSQATTPSTSKPSSSLLGVQRHLDALQAIATANGGTRAAGTPGYDASRDYVAQKLRRAGYRVTLQPFQYVTDWEELSPPVLEQVAPNPKTYSPPSDFVTVGNTPSGDVTALVQAVELTLPPTPTPTSTSGCELTDFAGFVAGRIALIQRGTCPFQTKVDNAEQVGASAVIVFNEGQPGRTDPFFFSLASRPLSIPVVFTSFAVGNELAANPNTTAHLETDTLLELTTSHNVIAESKKGNANNVVMVGAHLDSVSAGPGINDNGSGTAGVLSVAETLGKVKPRNKLRFAFWGAEELGLIGSTAYVASLSPAELAKVQLYLNFDMIASPNYALFVYDGDDSDGVGAPAGPPGSAEIEALFEQYYDVLGQAHLGTDFNGRSDYGPFIAAGIPAGGLFTGAEGIKTPAEAALFGGTAGVAYDVCYHQACDTIANINQRALHLNVGAIAVATAVYAFSRDLPGT